MPLLLAKTGRKPENPRRTSCIAGATLRYGRQGDHQRSSGEPWQESRHLGTGLNPAAHQGLPATKDLQPVHMWPWMHQILDIHRYSEIFIDIHKYSRYQLSIYDTMFSFFSSELWPHVQERTPGDKSAVLLVTFASQADTLETTSSPLATLECGASDCRGGRSSSEPLGIAWGLCRKASLQRCGGWILDLAVSNWLVGGFERPHSERCNLWMFVTSQRWKQFQTKCWKPDKSEFDPRISWISRWSIPHLHCNWNV